MLDAGPTRRHILATSGSLLGAIAVAGCLQDDGDEDGETTTTIEGTTAEETGDGDDGTTQADETTEETTVGDRPAVVTFDAPHGATIEGTLYGRGDCGVVLVPQINLDRGSWEGDAKRLADQEYLVLAIDEDPDDRPSSVRGAIRYLREQHDVSSLVLIGASSGAEAAVIANANSDKEEVDGTIALSPGGGEEYASELQGSTLFVVSEGDDERFVRVTKELHNNAPHPSELITYPGSAHGQGILESEHGEDLRTRIVEFVQSACDGESG